MKNQFKKQMILFFLLFGGIITSFAQNESSLNGAWELEKVEKFKKENTDYIPVDYIKSASSDIHAGIYETLKFKGDQCETPMAGHANYSNIYKTTENQLNLYFKPTVEIYEWNMVNNKLILVRTYSDIDEENQLDLAEYKIILTYKQK